jgi:DNA-binding beta-propeller fold protein YncE
MADFGNHRIQAFDTEGRFLGKWGRVGSGDGQFRYPNAVALGGDGTVYVADRDNVRIQAFAR